MIKHLFHKPIYTLFLSLIFFISCNGQIKNTTGEIVNDSKTITNGPPKMIKTQGKYTYRTATGPYADTNVCIKEILEDKHGNIWVATMGEGVYRYDGKSFTNYTVKDGLLTNLVYFMMEDKDGNIWFATTDGVSSYNGKSFSNFPFSVIKGNTTPQFSINANDPRKDAFNKTTEVWSMLQDKTGKIWFGTTNGLYCYDGVKFTSMEDLAISKNSISNIKTVTSIAEDKAGNIWFTSWADGLCRFDGKSITRVSNEGFNTMLLDRNGNFWLGRRANEGGVYHYDVTTFTKLFSGMPFITEMKEDKAGNIWFSNAPHGGMIYYNPSTSAIISRLTEKDGLPRNHISSVTIDKSGNVWFGMCGMTLTKYDGKTFSNFYSE